MNNKVREILQKLLYDYRTQQNDKDLVTPALLAIEGIIESGNKEYYTEQINKTFACDATLFNNLKGWLRTSDILSEVSDGVLKCNMSKGYGYEEITKKTLAWINKQGYLSREEVERDYITRELHDKLVEGGKCLTPTGEALALQYIKEHPVLYLLKKLLLADKKRMRRRRKPSVNIVETVILGK